MNFQSIVIIEKRGSNIAIYKENILHKVGKAKSSVLTCKGTILTKRTGNWCPATVCFKRNVSGIVSFFSPLKKKKH